MILRWNQVPDADAYDVQFATSPDFDPLSLIATKRALRWIPLRSLPHWK
ncbi:MAG: hypothetical protein R2792_13520 [Saprospiraceae bacterium]